MPIRNGDELTIGGSVFLFVHPGEVTEGQSTVAVTDMPTQLSLLRPEDSVYLRRDAITGRGRAARDLAALLYISTEISQLRDTTAITDWLGSMVGKVMGCEDTGLTFLDGAFPATDLVAVLEDIRVLAVPLVSGGRTLGILRLEAAEKIFDNDHLQFFSAVAAIASLALENAARIEYLEGENRRLLTEGELNHELIGESPQIREVFQLVSRAAPSATTVLIQGESGTGKELVARAIHNNSGRRDKPFLAINCASLNEHLLDSELFGHEKGAFTGAVAQKRGKLEIADGGTLFLDEIGEMAVSIQARLLRVLQQREFERVGGTRTLRVDVRIVAATNRDLLDAVRTGTFRQDLYYRLNVISIETPPLRERRSDIPLLGNYFASRFAARDGRAITGISPAARTCLVQYDWPGNVRELENAIERAVVLGSSNFIEPEDLPETILEAASPPAATTGYHTAVKEAKRKVILSALGQSGGNHGGAAKLLGVNPTYLSRLIRNLALKA
jgi:Nif-specific regulatory protein